MASYKSQFKGSQIDNAVSVANANLNKGSNDTPIYYDSEGLAQPIEKDTTATVSSVKPLTSGGAYTGLEAVVDNSDIQNENFNGEFTVVGNVSIVDGVASGFGSTTQLSYAGKLEKTINLSPTSSLEIQGEFQLPSTDFGDSFRVVFELYQYQGSATTTFVAVNGSTLGFRWRGNGASYNPNILLTYGKKYFYKLSYSNGTYTCQIKEDGGAWQNAGSQSASALSGPYTLTLGSREAETYNYFTGSLDLNQFSISVDGKVVYTPYPNPALPPSQNAVKQYVDTEAALKQDMLYGGYGIDVNGATVSVSDDVFREDEEARLHADLKVDHFGDMSVGNDSEVLELMNEARHSSFDRSKFTVVGNPTITDDGIASGYSVRNIVQANYQLRYLYNKSWTVSTVFKYSTLTAPNPLFALSNEISFGGVGVSATVGMTFQGRFGDSTTEVTNAIRLTSFVSSATIGNRYKVTLDFNINTGLYTLSYKGLDDNISDTGTYTPTTEDKQIHTIYLQSTSLIRAAGGVSWTGNSCSLDLKQFSITVDGVEVFSGNKTGIDTIKPDNYTVVGAPTITDDGVASELSLSNYLTSSEIDVTEKSFSINLGKIKVKDTSNTQILFGGNTAGKLFSIAISAAQKKFYISSNSTNFNTVFTDNITLHVGDEYYLIGGVENNEAYLKYSVDGNNWIEIRTSITTPYTDLQTYIGAGILNNGSMSYFRDGSIDLNAFKIYVDGNLVYQPCLKIPYTQTKDGKKIVDYNYRSRVEDEYAQAGFTPYYTLSDTDYTMATVEEDDIVASLDGATSYTQRADLSIEQQGTTTSGTAVTFPKAFMDTNYALSLPYSAKTKAGFTAAADGDYIAEGNVSI